MARRKAHRGFTLMQLMLGVMSLGVILCLAANVMVTEPRCGGRRLSKAILTQVASQLDIFKLDHGRYPDALDDLVVAPNYVKPENYPPEGYLKEHPVNGWGHKLVYRPLNSTVKPYVLLSLGADGRAGGEGLDADIAY